MNIRQKILSHLAAQANQDRVADLRIGLGYTAVMLDSGRIGLAGTPIREASGGCTVFDGMHPVAGRPAIDLLQLIVSDYPIAAAVGLATANALANRPSPYFDTGDVLSFIRPGPGDHIGMVGNFAPMVSAIRMTGARLTIFEKIDLPQGDLRPEHEIPQQLPGCTIALVTATSIINGTFDRIIESASGCRSVVVLGASTPLIPEVFAGTPVFCLSGVIVQSKEILQVVSCGGGMRRFKGTVLKVNLAI